MPVYKAQDMQATPDVVNPSVMMMQFGGEAFYWILMSSDAMPSDTPSRGR